MADLDIRLGAENVMYFSVSYGNFCFNNNNNYDNLYGAVTRPYRYKGA